MIEAMSSPINMRFNCGLIAKSLCLAALGLASLLSNAWSGGRQQSDSKQDANKIVRQMIATYKGAQSFAETSKAHILVLGQRERVQTNEIRYKRPNLLLLKTEDPNFGSLSSYCNGRTVTISSARQNIYTKRTAATTLTSVLEIMSHATKDMMHTDISQTLNPLNFFAVEAMPDESHDYRYIGIRRQGNHTVHLVMGSADADWLSKFPIPPGATVEKRDILLWIDTKTHLLIRADCQLLWTFDTKLLQERSPVTAAPGKKSINGTGKIGLLFTEIHNDPIINDSLRDEDFSFIPPKGARERFETRRPPPVKE